MSLIDHALKANEQFARRYDPKLGGPRSPNLYLMAPRPPLRPPNHPPRPPALTPPNSFPPARTPPNHARSPPTH